MRYGPRVTVRGLYCAVVQLQMYTAEKDVITSKCTYIYVGMYVCVIGESNEIFHVCNKPEIRNEHETKYHFEKEQDTNGKPPKDVLEIHGWQDCRYLNILVCQVS